MARHAATHARLRAANVIHPGQVYTAVAEATGDVFALHTHPDESRQDLDLGLFIDVRGAGALRGLPNVRMPGT